MNVPPRVVVMGAVLAFSVAVASRATAAPTPEWQAPMPASGPPTGFTTMTFDPAAGAVVAFDTSNAKTWTWDGASWAACTRCTTPLGASGFLAYIAFDAQRGVVVLLAPDASNPPRASVYEWSGAAWTQSCTSASCTAGAPPWRTDGALVTSPTAGVFLFGGASAAGAPLNDSWQYDGTAWTQLCAGPPCSATVPSARQKHAMAYDSARKKVVLFGGFPALGDTWEWDGAAWVEACTAAACAQAVPSGRAYPGLSYDSILGATVLFGGVTAAQQSDADLWTWNGSVWTSVPYSSGPNARWGTRQAFDAAHRATFVFGGVYAGNTGSDDWTLRFAGGACSSSAGCESGTCVDGFCCDTACGGACEACNVPGKEGVCTPVHGAPVGPRRACAGSGTCGGSCDGANAAACTYPSVATTCAGACVGSMQSSGTCDGMGACSGAPSPCAGALVCDAATNRCKSACAIDGDCVEGYTCDAATRACVPKSGPACDGHHTLVAPGGATQDCAPYGCAGTTCRMSCQSVADCVAPFVCDGSGECVAPPSSGAEGGCVAGSSSDAPGALAVAAVAMAAAGRRRRRRRP